MTISFTPPATDKTAFHCPTCKSYAMQHWSSVHLIYLNQNGPAYTHHQSVIQGYSESEVEHRLANGVPTTIASRRPTDSQLLCAYVAQCSHCQNVSLWIDDKQVYPPASSAPPPNSDLPDGLRKDFEEARAILHYSPRGAAALLRLVTQKLCRELGEAGNNLNDDIRRLGKKGLNQGIIDALDSVRVIGNNAVHPGEMDLSDDVETATALFELVNIVVEKMISDPKKIQSIRSSIPARDKANIKKRDTE